MKIALASDHRGRDAVATLRETLRAAGHEVELLGPTCTDSCDYPDSAFQVGRAVASGAAECGILVCGSGIGMSMAANKIDGVRAALVHDRAAAEMTRRHNDANVLCLSGDRMPLEEIIASTKIFLETPFDGGRHQRRVDKIIAIERGLDPASIAEAAASDRTS